MELTVPSRLPSRKGRLVCRDRVEKCILWYHCLWFLLLSVGAFLSASFPSRGGGLLLWWAKFEPQTGSALACFSRSCLVVGRVFARFAVPNDCFSDSLLA